MVEKHVQPQLMEALERLVQNILLEEFARVEGMATHGYTEARSHQLQTTLGEAFCHAALALVLVPAIDALLAVGVARFSSASVMCRQLVAKDGYVAQDDSTKNLAPRPDVRGLAPWESTTVTLNGKEFKNLDLEGPPTQHLPGGECTGFVLESPSFGVNEADGLPNVVNVSGDTVHIPQLANELPKRYHVVVALMNLGKAIAPLPTGPVQITMGGEQAAQLTRDIGAEKMVPLHFESWKHFTQSGDEVRAELAADAAVKDKVVWVVPGVRSVIVYMAASRQIYAIGWV